MVTSRAPKEGNELDVFSEGRDGPGEVKTIESSMTFVAATPPPRVNFCDAFLKVLEPKQRLSSSIKSKFGGTI
jgi:hypothetical protein